MDKLKQLHEQENTANKVLTNIDKELRFIELRKTHLERKKKRVAYFISNNMKYRNELINGRN